MGTRHRLLAGASALVIALAGAVGVSAPARAAVPDGHGFVLWNGAAVVPSGTWPPATTVTAGGIGVYRIIFPGQAARGGVVHVTAINSSAVWCQAMRWGPSGADELAYVRCYRPGGTPVNTAFTAVFTSSSPPDAIPGLYGYAHAQPTGAIVSEYNSVLGGGNSVTHLGSPGQYHVTFPALGTPGPFDGSVQLTAVNSSVGAHCEVARWSSSLAAQDIIVLCFNATGAPFDTGFTVSYQFERSLFGHAYPPRNFGYIWNRPPLPAPNPGPPPTNFSSVAGPGANGLSASGLGLTLVSFRAVAQQPDTVQVTPFGRGGEFCNIQAGWFYSGSTVLVRNVACYTAAGVRVDAGSFTSYNSEF
ncbi:hypothetical protein [Phytohabitans kaempferiae]|uniref:Uncharacterized protein n=1 Tax=Phytohabitans kaempferiae TaxID=1620943 RepID=A0ABV6M2G6_9ACTN